MILDNFWLLLNIIAAFFTVGVVIFFFLRNHTFKKWLRLYEAIIVGYYGIIYTLTLTGILHIHTYSIWLRPIAYALLLIPAIECLADKWRKYERHI